MANDGYSLHIVADLTALERVRQFVEAKAQALGVMPAAVYDILLAVDELATNIVAYGYRGEPGPIDIAMRRQGDAVIIHLADRAPLFDPTAVPPPDITLPLHERPAGGNGIHMARHFVDEMTHRARDGQGNEVMLIKKGVVAMEISTAQMQGRVPVTVLHITGPVISNVEIEQRAQAAFDAGAKNILLDLTDVPYMATSGLRALHAIYTLLRTDSPEESDAVVKKGIADGTFTSPHLKLLKPSAHVIEALKVAGYDMFLEIHTDLKRAIASF